MIQRVQSIFLVIVSGLSALLMYFPFAKANTDLGEVIVHLRPFAKILDVKDVIVLPQILNVLVGSLAFYTILIYKNRKKQMLFAALTALMTLGLLAILFLLDYVVSVDTKTSYMKYTWAIGIPAVQFVLLFLARFFINKDEKLVKSVDRLR
jgi:CDP-diglyceride synthetase